MAYQTISIKVDVAKVVRMGAEAVSRAEGLLDLTSERIANETRRNIIEKHVVDTGALLGSIHTEKPGALKRIIADGVEYGVYNEFGTSKLAARPFLTPAFEQERRPFLAAWEQLTR